MIKYLIYCSFFLLSNLVYSQELKDNFIHVVYDLDWTLINQGPNTATPSRNLISVLNEKYFVSEGAQDVLTAQSKNPRIKISFYSGGERARNIEALKKIKLTDGSGRSLYDIAFKILSKDDLHRTDAPESAKFAERFKKDLTLITSNMDNVVLVDDLAIFSLQKGKLLHLGRTYTIFEKYSEAERAYTLNPQDKFIPSNRPAWTLDRYKIPAVHGIIDEAINQTEKGVTFSQAVQKLSSEPREKFLLSGLEKINLKKTADQIRKESHQRQKSIKKIRKLFKMPQC